MILFFINIIIKRKRGEALEKSKIKQPGTGYHAGFMNSDHPLAATDIPKINEKLSVNTVQAVLKKLLKIITSK